MGVVRLQIRYEMIFKRALESRMSQLNLPHGTDNEKVENGYAQK